ncbi:MAG: class I SAM-dependent methyltransferase [Sulfurimonas sp.]|uniref:class I SAM-dependent methyltransferase n=1 Tax=Sulfurimonas sp. TaxID=2022749 RepID=UPI002607D720|nr:class I SAM-dependent methyltransferase [Sulfurimonas sp.]MDD2653035.1 class I SAM-dependent methyltransferase [Sulfurimonas sp.]MDD3452272.1 class I SAM-dependent methyltransferase [Sulfurimonas sp.]
MNRELSNPEQYSDLWNKESEFLESHQVYSQLSKMTPAGKALEFGCGVGNGTHYLSIDREVLSLDNNSQLIEKARDRANKNVAIYQCDFFELTEADKLVIAKFNPQVIVGWFIGGCGIDIFKRTKEEPDEMTKSKLYREKIEDIIVSPIVCLASVEYIHLVSRGNLAAGFSEAEIFEHTKNDYDTHVFKRVGFDVIEVKNINWPREGSEFQYGQAHNPNFAGGRTVPIITSIVAKRVKHP